LTWSKTIKGYRPVADGENPFSWDLESRPALATIQESVKNDDYLRQLSALWSQESTKGGAVDIRVENLVFFKFLGIFRHVCLSQYDIDFIQPSFSKMTTLRGFLRSSTRSFSTQINISSELELKFFLAS